MTKVEMIKVIEKSNMVKNFSNSYMTRQSKANIERLYKMAIEYMNR
jgi:hypothetical protein